jgi:hypothetical protein
MSEDIFMRLLPRHGKPYKNSVGRKRRWHESAEARFPAGTLARIKAVLKPKEYMTDLIWRAIERELKHREMKVPKKRR